MTSKKDRKTRSKITWHLQETGVLPVNSDISFWRYYQLSTKKELRPGDKFKVKGQRGTFIFYRHCKNTRLETEWIDCYDKDKARRAFRPELITKKVK